MLPPSWKSEVQKAIEETVNRDAAERETSEAEKSTAVAGQLSALVNQLEGKESREKTSKQIKIWTDSITLALVAVTAGFTGLAWWVFRGQLGIMRQSVDAQIESLTQEQRGIFKIKNWKIDPDALVKTGTPIFSFQIENTGHTPTYTRDITYDYAIAPGLPQTFEINKAPIAGLPALIYQGETVDLSINDLPAIDSDKLSKILNAGSLFIFLRVIAEYRDTSGLAYDIRATAQYGRLNNSPANKTLGFQFPEVRASDDIWLNRPNSCRFSGGRQYNSFGRASCRDQ